ncbi:uncharacterized protein [Watersipora subatra]|uniref:uncharacterized protein isoform X2 n=1 Tax=Watersipora subatra TaxID=2589382 RepID=UPI00355BDA2B
MQYRMEHSGLTWIRYGLWILYLSRLALSQSPAQSPAKPEFIYTPRAQVSARLGQTVYLRATVSGYPIPTLTWYKDGIELRSSLKIAMNSEELQINDMQESDVGWYTCKFANNIGHITYTTQLFLEGGAMITVAPRNQNVSSGQSMKFQCQGRANPNNVTYLWYKDGRNIVNRSSKYQTNSDGSLDISYVGENDSGMYRCVVSNGLGAPMYAEARLTVVFKPLVDSNRWQTHVYIPIGRTGTLPCPVRGVPPVTHVVWSLRTAPLDLTSPRLEVENSTFSLLIHNVTVNDSGWYTCTPYNDNGMGVQSDLMVVAAVDPPYFTTQPELEYSINIEETITMPCSASSTRVDRVTISWEKDYGRMPDSSRLTLHSGGDITIRSLNKEDDGVYKCIASDGDITSAASTKLTIHNTTPHAPRNVTAYFTHYSITISWLAGFDGGYKQTYVVLLRESKRSNRNWQRLELQEQEETSFTIYGLIPATEYELAVLPKNQLGDGSQSNSVIGETLGYKKGTVGALPKDGDGNIIFPTIVKPIGPQPGFPENVSVQHDGFGGVLVAWEPPLETPVPVLYYRIEYRNESHTEWLLDDPILANATSANLVPKNVEDDVVKYYFRVRAYGLLSYSEYSEAVIIFLPQKPAATALKLSEKIGIGVAAVAFVGLLIAALVILCDLKPKRQRKRNNDKNGERAHYSLAPQTTNGTSEWQSFYPYNGGRFTINGEADDIYVVDRQRDNVTTLSSMERDGLTVRREPEWHAQLDLARTFDSNSSDKPPAHGIGYTANYSTYNGLLHGYYDARTGTQISPSIVNYPHSGIEIGYTTDGNTSNDTAGRRNHTKDRQKPTNQTKNESQPIYANHLMTSRGASNSNWFAPHQECQERSSSPISLSYDREQEIVLKPSLPRHSSMKPSVQVPGNDEEMPFDPHLSIIRENSVIAPDDPLEYDSLSAEEYPYTNGWVESQARSNLYNNRQTNQQRSNTLRETVPEPIYRPRGYYTLTTNDLDSVSPHIHRLGRFAQDRDSSISSSVNEMRTHYNRERLLGTVERVRSTSSRSRRPGSFASHSSDQLSPRYAHSPLPPPYPLTECYPELVSPVYYNNNNNRQSESAPSYSNRSSHNLSPAPHYENSSLLKSMQYHRPLPTSRPMHEMSRLGSSGNGTSGFGSSWSQSHNEGHQRRSRPSWSRSSVPTPYEYDISCESSPAVTLPEFSNASNNHFGLYARPKLTTPHISQRVPQFYHNRDKKTSYDPSFIANNYYSHTHKSSQVPVQAGYKAPLQAPSDSVDENYEFDPILIDSEPHDFFHVQYENVPDATSDESSQTLQRPSLYAEQSTPPASSTSQRFNRLRNEFYTYKDRQRSPHYRLESAIL